MGLSSLHGSSVNMGKACGWKSTHMVCNDVARCVATSTLSLGSHSLEQNDGNSGCENDALSCLKLEHLVVPKLAQWGYESSSKRDFL